MHVLLTAVTVDATESCILNSHGRRGRRREWESRELIWKESGGRGSGERESLVIYISIPSTACAVRQPVCPNKQPAEGGCLIITSPLSHPEFTFHLTTNTRPRLRLCPLSPLEFQDVSGASKATIHMLFSTRRGQHSTRRHPGRHNEDSLCLVLREFKVGALYSPTHLSAH